MVKNLPVNAGDARDLSLIPGSGNNWLYPGQSIKDLKKKKIRRQVFLAPRVTSGNIIRFEENGHHAAIFLSFVSSVTIAVNTVGRSFKNQMSSSHLTHP